MIFAIRFGFPVRTHVLKTACRAAAKNVTVGEYSNVDSATLVKGNRVVRDPAAESIQNGPVSGAAAEKEIRFDARGAPVPGGPGAAKTVCFQLFLKNE